jgi:hypothetical protein
MAISFDLDARRSCGFAPDIAAQIAALHAAHAQLPHWQWVGRQRVTLAELNN